MGRTLVIGDIHGAYKALVQCLERSGFDKEKDTLITIGDVCDGWHETPLVIDELLTIKNRIDIRGNHDEWFLNWLNSGMVKYEWESQGGEATLNSYITPDGEFLSPNMDAHRKFLEGQHYYYLDDKNRLFVHGGLDWHIPITENKKDELMWDRHAFATAIMWNKHNTVNPTNEPGYFRDYTEVFIGHSATNRGIGLLGNSFVPLQVTNLWNMDQGAGWNGKLSIMDVDTKEFWQSDNVQELYKDYKGRL